MLRRDSNAQLWDQVRAFGLEALHERINAEGERVSLRVVYKWFEPGKKVPRKRVELIARITHIAPALIRPDLYPASSSTTNASSAETIGAPRTRAHDAST